MKIHKNRLLTCLLLIGLGLTKTNLAQTGVDCVNAITVTQTYTQSLSVLGAEKWYKFTATSEILNLNVNELYNNVNVSKVELYSGNCATLNLITKDSLTTPNDSIKTIVSNTLTVSSVYYIKLSFLNTNTQSNYTLSINQTVLIPLCTFCTADYNTGVNYACYQGCAGNAPTINICIGTPICITWDCNQTNGSTQTFSFSNGDPPVIVGSGYQCGVYTPSTVGNVDVIAAALVDTQCDGILLHLNVIGTPTIFVNSKTICTGQSATLTATGSTSYTWSTNQTTNPIVVSPTVTTAYTVSTSNSCGTSTAVALVTVVNPPILTVTPSQTICAGQTKTLTASGASTYTWSTGANTSSIAITPSITTTYTVTGANTSGCVSTKTVTIYVAPNFTLTATASPTVICAGNSTTLTASGATSYTWSPGALNSASVVVSPTITTTYTVAGNNGGCTNTKTLTILVNPKPTVTITASSATVCAGSTVTLSATAGLSTYSWFPCSSGCNTNTLVYTAVAGSNTYSINVTGTNGCTNTAVKTITAVASPTLSVNSASICSGNTATLTASGASAYTWTPGAATGSMVVVSPTVTTNYTVTGINVNGCTSSAISSVFVSSNPPAPFSILTNPPSPVIANGTGTNTIILSTSITNTTGLTFSWLPSGAPTATTNFNLSQPEIISLTVNNTLCGGSTTQSICVNYVANTCSNTALPVLNNYTLTSPTQIANGSYFVTGTLTLAWSWDDPNINSASLDNKSFLMSTGSKVVIPPTAKVRIGLTKFYSCSGMWQGIELQSNATNAAQIALGGVETRIEDAYKAISCTNPLSRIIMQSGVVFNKNYIDVDISFSTNSGSAFDLNYTPPINYLSESSATSPGSNLKCSSYYAPTVKSRSYAGIKTNNVGVLNYNTPTLPANYSVVKNKDYGFYFTNTNANVNNVNFNNAVGIAYSYALNFVPKPAGVGIYSENSGYLNVKPAITPTIGATTTFSNMGYSIITNNTYTVDIQNTEHLSSIQSFTTDPVWGGIYWGVGLVGQAGYGLNGVFATNARDVMRVNNNTFNNNYYPVTANYTVAPSSTNTMSIAQNTINTSNVNGVREGVTFNSALTFTPTLNNMRIAANTFSNVSIGVKVTATSVGLRISNNTFTIHPSGTNPKGIYITGSNAVTADNNTIYGSLTSTNLATWNVNHHGILCENSPGCKIKCNTITQTGVGVEYKGGNSSPGDGLLKNNFVYPMRRGLVLSNGGIVGMQGSNTGTVTGASANLWTGAWPAANNADPNQTYVGGPLGGTIPSISANSPLWVRSTEVPFDNGWAAPSSPVHLYNFATTTFTTAVNDYTSCPTILTSGLKVSAGGSSIEDRDEDFVRYINTILPSTNAGYTPQDKFLLKQFMFDDLTQTPSSNVTLVNFYNQQQNTAINAYADIDSLLANGNLNLASTKNSSASTTNDITQTQNAYNILYINGIQSNTDLDNLAAIANLCPQQYGNAVYEARALLQSITFLSKDYNDSCYTNKLTARMGYDDEAKSVSVAEGVQARLYPNPNNGSFMLAYDLKNNTDATVTIVDIAGKLVFKGSIDKLDNITNISTNNLNNGIYFIQISHDKTLLWTDKLIISK